MADAPKKLKPMNRILDKLSAARSLVTVIELALGNIEHESTSEDAGDVRMVALMATKRLRKIERHLFAHHDAELPKHFPEASRHDKNPGSARRLECIRGTHGTCRATRWTKLNLLWAGLALARAFTVAGLANG
jgi:hypothetical protein